MYTDPDADGLLNQSELTNPNLADVTNLDEYAYRYTIQRQPTSDDTGSTCYSFTIENGCTSSTLDLRGAGFNTPTADRGGAGRRPTRGAHYAHRPILGRIPHQRHQEPTRRLHPRPAVRLHPVPEMSRTQNRPDQTP